jgi:mannan endo-1,4-beta-mannosidase
VSRLALVLLTSGACLACVNQGGARSSNDLEQHPPASFELEGKPFCFAGSNNYYPIFKPKPVVDDLFAAARALGLKVMRVWGMLERGSLDGSVPSVDGAGQKDGVYFQYWDADAHRPAYNDGPDGLVRLDYVAAAAAQHGIKLIVVLTNNWREFGGIDQYLLWYGRDKHHEFFTAPEVTQAYRDWVEHVITRKNSVTGVLYRDDPTIMAWELGNEPRCKNGSAFDSDNGWDKQTLSTWAGEMSAYVKSLDSNHLVSVGDEGFLDSGDVNAHFAYRAEGGVDHAALTALPNVDFGTFHLYPEDWRAPPQFAERWIFDHVALARALGKPTILEEYGARVTRAPNNRGEVSAGWPERRAAYRRWNQVLRSSGGNAALSWMLAGRDDDGARYPDYDGYAFYRDDATGQLLGGDAATYAAAPACAVQKPSSRPPSAFVRVRR